MNQQVMDSQDIGVVVDDSYSISASSTSPFMISYCDFDGPSADANSNWFKVGHLSTGANYVRLEYNDITYSTSPLWLGAGDIKNITYDHNTFREANGYILLHEQTPQTTYQFSNINITYNTFDSSDATKFGASDYGVMVLNTVDTEDADWSTITLSFNNFDSTLGRNSSGFPAVGFHNASTTNPSENIVADHNYWGSTSGYYHSTSAPSVVGAEISNNVTVSHYYQTVIPPEAPQNLTHSLSVTDPVLTWTPKTEASFLYYVIYRSRTSGFTPTGSDSIAKVNAPSYTYTDTGTTPGENYYYYKIAAVYMYGLKSYFSDQVAGGLTLSLSSIGNKSYREGQTISFTVTYDRYNGSGLRYILDSNIPSSYGATFNTSTGEFLWKPDFTMSGIYVLTFTATDGLITDSETITLTVSDVTLSAEGGTVDADSSEVSSSLGGTVQVGSGGVYSGHQVYIPPSALTTNVTVKILPPSTDDIPSTQIDAVPSVVNFVVKGYESTTYEFQDSIDVTIEYKDFEIGDNEENMRLHCWDPTYSTWKRIMSTTTVDTANNTVTAKVKHFTYIGADPIQELTANTSLSPGWTMISAPVQPLTTSSHPSLIFGDDIYPFLLETGNSSIYRYYEPSSSWVVPSSIESGLGYIVWGFYPPTGSSSYTFDVDGYEVTGDITHTLTYTVSDGGWHLLGNPYSVSIDWDNNITKGSGIDNTYYRWTGSAYDFYTGGGGGSGGLTSTISAWNGFWVHTTTDGAELTINYPGSSSKRAVENSVIAWRIQIEAECSSNKDIYNYLGMSEQASTGYDFTDAYELEPLSDKYVSVYFPHSDWDKHSGNFTQDIRPLTDDPTIWDLVIATNSSDDNIILSWTIPEEIDEDLDVLMTADEGGEVINMREQNTYSFSIPKTIGKSSVSTPSANPASLQKLAEDNVSLHKFTIAVQNSEATGVEEISIIPDEYYLRQNFPNPFNPSTTIEYGIPEAGNVSIKIYNIIGQEVRSLVNNKQEAGAYNIIWDGKDNWGTYVASGVYFYKITVNKYQNIQKLILLR